MADTQFKPDQQLKNRTEDRRTQPRSASQGDNRRMATADRRHENNLQYATFFLQDHFLGVAVKKVQEVLSSQSMTPVPLAPPVIAGLINLRGQIVTVIDLRTRFGFPQVENKTATMNIIVKTVDGPISLLADQIGDVIEVRPDLFELPPENLDERLGAMVEGVYKLKGKLLLALNIDKVVNMSG